MPECGAMAVDAKIPSTDRLPYAVYAILAGFVAWMALAAWGFAGPGYADLSLTVVTLFLVVVVAIPVVLWRVWRANSTPKERMREPLADFATGEFETWQDRVKGRNAAAEIILPIAAAAVGMTALAIVFHYAALYASV
jgi:hypothetical protein